MHLDGSRQASGAASAGDTIENVQVVFCGSGNDRVVGSDANNVIHGGGGNDTLFGGGGNDSLYGDAGNDLLDGGAGADLFRGGQGVDTADYSRRSGALHLGIGTRPDDGA